MSWQRSPLSRRATPGIAGAAATVWGGERAASAEPAAHPSDAGGPGAVRLLLNGEPATMGTYAFPTEIHEIVLDNCPSGSPSAVTTPPGASSPATTTPRSRRPRWSSRARNWPTISMESTRATRTGSTRSTWTPPAATTVWSATRIRVARVEPGLAEVVFADVSSEPLRYEHHLIMRAGRRGLYGYTVLTATTDTRIQEMRMNARWDRAVLDHCFNWERGKGQQPTYAYLATQKNLADETWQVDGVDNPDLPSPQSNAGGTEPGDVYTKYDWSLYHFENPMFGHYGHGFGAWSTPLGGVSDETLAGFYGVGPQRQDLATHQDALILNYFGPDHYGLPNYDLPEGYRRLYGPWLTYLTVGDPDDPDAVRWSDGTAGHRPTVLGPDPNAFPVPVSASIPPGGSATVTLRVDDHDRARGGGRIEVGFHANGGRVRGSAWPGPTCDPLAVAGVTR